MNREQRRKNRDGINILSETIAIIKKYMPELINKFDNLTDLRHQSYVKYKMKVIFMVRLMGLMCSIKSMNEMTSEFNTQETIENIARICELELNEIPHCDTINDVFEKVKVEEIEEIIKDIITKLIRGKILTKFLVRDKYYHIIVDGTGLATSRKRYNKNCLVKNKTDKNGNKYQEYSTYVLEAKLVVGNMVFSIGSEFVENSNNKNFIHRKISKYKKLEKRTYNKKEDKRKNLSYQKYKQDCEIKAFERLAKKIKKNYPRLNILISGDALYANQKVIDICKKNKWKYIIRLKEGAIPTLYKEFEKIVSKENECNVDKYEFVTKIAYKDYETNVIRYKDKEIEFTYMTNLPITNKNIESSIIVGRKRWKIENEGFNIQKNGTFDIGHLYSKNAVAIKIHYLMIQIAHIIRQLVEKGSIAVKSQRLKIKEISQLIKKKLTSTLVDFQLAYISQLRFDE